MMFDRSRVYTAVNADELKAGDKVIVADDLDMLKRCVKDDSPIDTIRIIGEEDYLFRFGVKGNCVNFALAYLVERKENCTNCEGCGDYVDPRDDRERVMVCSEYKPNTETPELISLGNGQYAEKPKTTEDKWCKNCGVEACSRAGVDADVRCPAWQPKAERKCGNCIHRGDCITSPTGCDKYAQEAPANYRPFKDTDELIKVWCEKGGKWQKRELTMPYIWVRRKTDLKNCGHLVTDFNCIGVTVQGQCYAMSGLFANFEFLDGSPCGVEE